MPNDIQACWDSQKQVKNMNKTNCCIRGLATLCLLGKTSTCNQGSWGPLDASTPCNVQCSTLNVSPFHNSIVTATSIEGRCKVQSFFREGKFGGWNRMMLFYIVVFSHLECVLSVLKLYSGFRHGKMQGQLKITRITKQWSKLDPWFIAIRIVSYWTMRYDHIFWGLVMFCHVLPRAIGGVRPQPRRLRPYPKWYRCCLMYLMLLCG